MLWLLCLPPVAFSTIVVVAACMRASEMGQMLGD